jgi:hypothetical protein
MYLIGSLRLFLYLQGSSFGLVNYLLPSLIQKKRRNAENAEGKKEGK